MEEPVSKVCFGIALTADPAAMREQLDRFCAALGAAAGLAIEPRGLWHYNHLLDALQAGEVDFAWLPPILALRAIARRRVLPIALPVRSGAASYSTALFSREGSPIRALGDLSGVRAAWVDRQSAAGYLIIRASLRARGVDLDRAFAADQFLGAHDAVARAVLEGEADVGATYAYLAPGEAALAVTRAGWGDAKVQILAHAGPIPADVIAANIRVPVAVMRRMQRALATSAAEPSSPLSQATAALFGAEGFIEPLAEHLDPLTALLEKLEEPTAQRRPTVP